MNQAMQLQPLSLKTSVQKCKSHLETEKFTGCSLKRAKSTDLFWGNNVLHLVRARGLKFARQSIESAQEVCTNSGNLTLADKQLTQDWLHEYWQGVPTIRYAWTIARACTGLTDIQVLSIQNIKALIITLGIY